MILNMTIAYKIFHLLILLLSPIIYLFSAHFVCHLFQAKTCNNVIVSLPTTWPDEVCQ